MNQSQIQDLAVRICNDVCCVHAEGREMVPPSNGLPGIHVGTNWQVVALRIEDGLPSGKGVKAVVEQVLTEFNVRDESRAADFLDKLPER